MQESNRSIRVRYSQTGEEVSVHLGQLQEWIIAGMVNEDDMVNGPILTSGEWVRLGDTRLFFATRGDALPEHLHPVRRTRDWGIDSETPHIPPPAYGTLIVISGAFKFLAVIVAIIGIIAAFLPAAAPGANIVALVFIVQGAVGGLFLWLIAELILLFMSMERSSRAAERILARNFDKPS